MVPSVAAGGAERGQAFSVSMRHAFVPFSGYYDDIYLFFASSACNFTPPSAVICSVL